ncbi:helix-turn-helix domain-containing protein [Pseudonocardia acaciae]|uniref:helix-turn-helix domain-containing protein n=1 Tax=Pseudonocardia acaciae TaxID=551276 RepID=UPI0006877F26|nr:helix-turn-helix transcriptional regulator [Pseudonocardia acaciae]
MTTNPTDQARQALGARLRDIRKDADLTGRALATRAGWYFTKISKIEHGTQTPSENDLRTWCRHCNAEDQVPDLIATVRSIESMYVEWRRLQRTGMKHLQVAGIPQYKRTRLFRIYEPALVPGLFQTPDYASAIMAGIIEFREIPNDVDEAVAARMERQQVLYSGDRRFLLVMEEQALRTRVGDADTMAGQLDRLLTVQGLHRVSLGIIPTTAPRTLMPREGFWIFDETSVDVETWTAALTITQPREIAVYAKAFERLRRSAVYGREVRGLIANAVRELDTSEPPGVTGGRGR